MPEFDEQDAQHQDSQADRRARRDHPLVEIDVERLVADRRDVEWQTFLKKARQQRKVLREKGRLR